MKYDGTATCTITNNADGSVDVVTEFKGLPPPPNLVVVDLASENGLVEGEPVIFTATLQNTGASDAGKSTTRFRLDTDTILNDVDTPPVPAGETVVVTSAQWTAVVGVHTVQAIADVFNDITETTEDDNIRGIEIVVAEAPMPIKAIGLFALPPAFKDANKYNDPLTEIANTIPELQGSLWREHWYLLEKSGPGDYQWKYYDAAFQVSRQYNKLATVEIVGGQTAPAWFYALPNAAKLVCTRGGYETTVPWDPVLQSCIHNTMISFRDRYYETYKDLWRYVKIWQVGKASESNLVQYVEDLPAAHALAQSSAYSWSPYVDAHIAWQTGVETLMDMTADVFNKKIPFWLVTLPPFPDDPAFPGRPPTDDLQVVFDYGRSKYGWWFGTRSDSLYENSPKAGTFPYEIVKSGALLSSNAGYQMGNKMTPNDPSPPAKLQSAMNIALEVGAHSIEFFKGDYDNPLNTPVFIDTWNKMQLQGTK